MKALSLPMPAMESAGEEPFLEDVLLTIHTAFDGQIQPGRGFSLEPWGRVLEAPPDPMWTGILLQCRRWGGAEPLRKDLWVGQGLHGHGGGAAGEEPDVCLLSVCCLSDGSVWVLPG